MKIIVWLMFCSVTWGQVKFDGINDYVNCGDYPLGTNKFTISTWIKPNDVITSSYIVSNRGDTSDTKHYLLSIYNNDVSFFIDDNTTAISVSAPISINTLYHIVGVRDYADTIKIYVNGEDIDSANDYAGGSDIGGSESTLIGNRPDLARNYSGMIQDTRIYTRALSAGEISEIYRRPWTLADDPDLVLRSNINDKWDYAHVEDMSGNGNTVTNHGVDLYETSSGWVGKFDGSSDYAAGSTTANNPGTNDFSLSVWLKIPTVSGGAGDPHHDIYIKGDRGVGAKVGYAIYVRGDDYMSQGQFCGMCDDDIAPISFGSGVRVDDNTWHHGVFVVDRINQEARLFVDGTMMTNIVSTITDTLSSVGHYSVGVGYLYGVNQNYFDGELKNLMYFSKALSTNEAMTLYTNGTIDETDLETHLSMQPSYLDTGDALTGVARNYGTDVDGTYSNSPTAAEWTIQTEKPSRATIDID